VTLTERPTAPDPAEGSVGNEVPPVPAATRERLDPPMPDSGLRPWLWALFVALLAGVLRFLDLGHPARKIFDEVYYAKDAADLLRAGHELNNEGTGPGFVAHPPLGKWCIALGEWIFGVDPVGWRFSAAVAGTLSVLVLARLARRMFRSTLLGCVAGLLLALDGLHLVQSRVALLDIFLMLFLLLSFACLVLDRDARRRQLLRALEEGRTAGERVPGRTFAGAPWWRIAAGVLMGCALGVKWSAVWYLLALVLVAFAWEVGARRSAGARRPVRDTILDDLGWTAAFVGAALLAYLASWTGWFVTDTGWDRQWAQTTGNGVPFVPDALVNLWHYHRSVLDFHTGLDDKHDYQSTPYSWLLLGRPVAYDYSDAGGCGAASCSAEVIALGTPLLWWSFIPALAVTTWRWIARRDWRGAAILAGVGAGIVPWFAYPERTMFFFYALPALPFLVLAVTLVLGMVLGPPGGSRERRLAGAVLVAAYVLVIAVTFAYFHPVYTGEQLTYAEWRARMWLPTWI